MEKYQAEAWVEIIDFLRQYGLNEFEVPTPYTGLSRTIAFLKHKLGEPPKIVPDCAERITAFRNKVSGKILKRHSELKGMFCVRDGKSPFFSIHNLLNHATHYQIYSALSKDRVEYKIGDYTLQGKIILFYIEDNRLAVRTSNFRDGDYDINSIKKAERKLLLKINGKDYYKGDVIFFPTKDSKDRYFVATDFLSEEVIKKYSPIFSSVPDCDKWIADSQRKLKGEIFKDHSDKLGLLWTNDQWQTVMDAMDEYAQQEVKNAIP